MGKFGDFSTKLIATLFGTFECKNAFDSDERNYIFTYCFHFVI